MNRGHPKCKMVTQMANDDRLCVYESRPRMIVKTRDSQGKFGLTTRSQSTLRKTPRIKVRQMQDSQDQGYNLG